MATSVSLSTTGPIRHLQKAARFLQNCAPRHYRYPGGTGSASISSFTAVSQGVCAVLEIGHAYLGPYRQLVDGSPDHLAVLDPFVLASTGESPNVVEEVIRSVDVAILVGQPGSRATGDVGVDVDVGPGSLQRVASDDERVKLVRHDDVTSPRHVGVARVGAIVHFKGFAQRAQVVPELVVQEAREAVRGRPRVLVVGVDLAELAVSDADERLAATPSWLDRKARTDTVKVSNWSRKRR